MTTRAFVLWYALRTMLLFVGGLCLGTGLRTESIPTVVTAALFFLGALGAHWKLI